MAHRRGDALRMLGIGAALATLTALVCLAYAASLDPRAISLTELSERDAVVMSCEASDTSSAEPLWCADPSSPHCIPAAPDAPHRELVDRVDFWADAADALVEPQAYVLTSWPRPRADRSRGRLADTRLERPPRA